MTSEETLADLHDLATRRAVRGKTIITASELASLVSDARGLAELLAALPKCNECGALATTLGNLKYTDAECHVCDEHRFGLGIGMDPIELPWAPVIRKKGAGK